MNSTFYKLTGRVHYNAIRYFATICFDVFLKSLKRRSIVLFVRCLYTRKKVRYVHETSIGMSIYITVKQCKKRQSRTLHIA